MIAQKCNASFNIKYQSSEPISDIIVYYEDPPGNKVTYFVEKPFPQSGGTVNLEKIQTSGTYNLEVELVAGSVKTKRNLTLEVGRCSPVSSCAVPVIKSMEVQRDGQLVMDYWVEQLAPDELIMVEYQIATDKDFTNIVYVKGGGDYTQFEYIDMKNSILPNNTQLFIRVRKYCDPNAISAWSNVVGFESGIWNGLLECYWLANGEDLWYDICDAKDGYGLKTKATFYTSVPEIGGFIYLANGMPASIDNIKNLDNNVPLKFKDNGLGYIRFSSVTPGIVYIIDPKTGRIDGKTDRIKCPRPS